MEVEYTEMGPRVVERGLERGIRGKGRGKGQAPMPVRGKKAPMTRGSEVGKEVEVKREEEEEEEEEDEDSELSELDSATDEEE